MHVPQVQRRGSALFHPVAKCWQKGFCCSVHSHHYALSLGRQGSHSLTVKNLRLSALLHQWVHLLGSCSLSSLWTKAGGWWETLTDFQACQEEGFIRDIVWNYQYMMTIKSRGLLLNVINETAHLFLDGSLLPPLGTPLGRVPLGFPHRKPYPPLFTSQSPSLRSSQQHHLLFLLAFCEGFLMSSLLFIPSIPLSSKQSKQGF